MNASEALRRSVELVQQHQLDAALQLLGDGIVVARDAGRKHDVARLSRHAGVLCEGHRDREAAAYYAEAALADPMDALVHIALGDAHARLGERDRAEQHWARFVEIASASVDPDVREALDRYLARPMR
jgi:hypothetical protein